LKQLLKIPNIKITNTIQIPIGIQSGAVTHHHDQSMTLVNLSTKKIRNNTPHIDIPLLEFVLFIINIL
jgi:hypothetical protein